MNRFFIPQTWIDGDRVCLSNGFAHQICHVLRLKPKDQVVVLDNTGAEYVVCLTEVGKHQVGGVIQEQRVCQAEPLVQITLFQSMLKRDKFEWVLQKCTEIGAVRIVPIITERSIVQKTEIKSGKMQRWQGIIREAAEQSGRGRVPELVEPISFSESLNWPLEIRIMAALEGNQHSIQQSLACADSIPRRSLGVWIGPEGGFDPEEVALASSQGVHCVRLGRRILRTETAGVVACALILHELKEL